MALKFFIRRVNIRLIDEFHNPKCFADPLMKFWIWTYHWSLKELFGAGSYNAYQHEGKVISITMSVNITGREKVINVEKKYCEV